MINNRLPLFVRDAKLVEESNMETTELGSVAPWDGESIGRVRCQGNCHRTLEHHRQFVPAQKPSIMNVSILKESLLFLPLSIA